MSTAETQVCAPAGFSLGSALTGFLASLFLLRLRLFLIPLAGSCFEAFALLSRDAPGIISETAGAGFSVSVSVLIKSFYWVSFETSATEEEGVTPALPLLRHLKTLIHFSNFSSIHGLINSRTHRKNSNQILPYFEKS